MNNIKIINAEGFANAISKCNEGLFSKISSADIEVEFEDIIPFEGYTKPINEVTGEEFPNCCSGHKNTYEYTIKWFAKFPNCCQYHKKLNGQTWFNKANYNAVTTKVVNQLSYTEHCITENIDKPDWYDAITEYIDWNKHSFGQLPDGYGVPVGIEIYLDSLIECIKKDIKNIPKEKGDRLVKFCKKYFTPTATPTTDLNILNATYQKWLKIFPFEISFFSQLKQHFSNQIPLLSEVPKVNRYTNIATAKLHSKESLIEGLLNLTNRLLTEINSLSLFNDGSLTEPQQIKLELILNERKLKLDKGYSSNSPDEGQRYRKILKDWFKDEKEFIDEITPLLKELPVQEKSSKNFQPNDKEMIKINPDSRYFETIQTFKKIINSDRAFKLIYNPDKETSSYPYLYENYKNEIDTKSIISTIYERLKKIFIDNHYTPKEIILLIENLYPIFEDYGKETKSALGVRNSRLGKESPLRDEYSKTIAALNEIRDDLVKKVNLLYSNMLRIERYELNVSDFENIQEELIKSYSKIIVTKFNLMKTAFEGALANSIDPNELFKHEISNVENIVLKGERYKIILKDSANLCPIYPPNINDMYHKLVRGLEFELIDEYVADLSKSNFDELINTKALIMYRDFLASYKIKKATHSSNTPKKTKQKRDKKIHALKWTGEPQKLSNLFYALANDEIIDTDQETFKKAFSGELLEKPLRIKWNLFAERSTQPELVGLFYFLDKIKSNYVPIPVDKKQTVLFYDAVCFSFVNAMNESLDRDSIRNRSNLLKYNCINSDKIDYAIKRSQI